MTDETAVPSDENVPEEETAPAGPVGVSEESDEDEEVGPLIGTASELAPGVGGVGDHPAPAVMADPETGHIRQHGEGPLTAGDQLPAGDAVDRPAGDGLDPEAREKLTAEHEPEQIATERPDLGTD